MGENLSTADLDERDVRIGDIWRLGTARLQLCQPRNPCWKIDERYGCEGMAEFIANNASPAGTGASSRQVPSAPAMPWNLSIPIPWPSRWPRPCCSGRRTARHWRIWKGWQPARHCRPLATEDRHPNRLAVQEHRPDTAARRGVPRETGESVSNTPTQSAWLKLFLPFAAGYFLPTCSARSMPSSARYSPASWILPTTPSAC
jgi:hypothetical protein